jgi:uncharacterized protein
VQSLLNGVEVDAQRIWREQAIACLEQQLDRYSQEPTSLQLELQPHLDTLKVLLRKLKQPLIQIAVFGWVSRGKSALLNALFDETLFPVDPLHGVTQWPRSVRWTPQSEGRAANVQFELTDTPGLDEIAGESRTAMAQSVAQCADLLLFVSAGHPSPAEQEALLELATFGKPLLLILNKADLYPDLKAETVYQDFVGTSLQATLSPQEIILTAAAPAPIQVRHEWPDGRTTLDWETPPPQVDELRQTLLDLLNREGLYLLGLNVFHQAQRIETQILQTVGQFYQASSQSQEWQFAGFKGVAVCFCPWWLDLLVSFALDAIQVRRLRRQLHLEVSDYAVKHLTPVFFQSMLWVGAANVYSAILLLSGFTNANFNITGWHLSEWLFQGIVAGYSALRLGQKAQHILLESIPFQQESISSILQSCLERLTPDLLLYRFTKRLRKQPEILEAQDFPSTPHEPISSES